MMHLFTHQDISLGQKVVHVHHLEKILMEQVIYTFSGKKEHKHGHFVLLQLKVISCSAA